MEWIIKNKPGRMQAVATGNTNATVKKFDGKQLSFDCFKQIPRVYK